MSDTKYENYNYIELGNLTQAARDKILEFPFPTPDDDEAITIEDLQCALELEEHSTFPEGVAKRLQELGVDCTEEDTISLAKEVKTRYKERIGEPDESTWKTLKKWINGQKTSVVNRETNYNLCYALNMDLKETETFFIKHFHSGAFNYKNAVDAIYFYCIHNSRPYSTIKQMLESASAFDDTNTTPADTVQIGSQIKDIDNDDEFLWFLSKHCYTRKQQYQRARATIVGLIDSLTTKVIGVENGNVKKQAELTDLSSAITGRVATTKKLSLGKLPDEFTKSLPTNKTFSDIKLGKDLTYDVLRKSLVVLILYDFYQILENEEEPTAKALIERRKDFEAEVNMQLVNCGFMPLYERNLFDAIILFCANSTFPIKTFHKIIELEYEPNT